MSGKTAKKVRRNEKEISKKVADHQQQIIRAALHWASSQKLSIRLMTAWGIITKRYRRSTK